ncbi:MAG: 6-carboxytetrahydropterin synthase [Candidatus Aenigmarchaeota archaeon]|nr:6-carboxytetrahydropterin synthase [Candidatus Aenigmarchaeota archaeon]
MPELFVSKEFDFSATATLRIAGEEGILQGHNYELRVTVKGAPDESGLVVHTSDLGEIVQDSVIRELDKKTLNDIVPNPTMENIAIWIWEHLKHRVKGLHEVRVWENRKKGNCAIYRG